MEKVFDYSVFFFEFCLEYRNRSMHFLLYPALKTKQKPKNRTLELVLPVLQRSLPSTLLTISFPP
jgi:hypothetical protein